MSGPLDQVWMVFLHCMFGKQAIEQTAGCCVTRIVQWCLCLAVLIAKRRIVFLSGVGLGMRGTGAGGWGAGGNGGGGGE